MIKLSSGGLVAILAVAMLFGCNTAQRTPSPTESGPAGRVEQVVYTTLVPRGWDLLLFESSSGTAKLLASHPAPDYDPAFSPDGRWVVFTSERRGNPDLWALDLTADAAPILLTPGDTMQDAAAISPDGRSIAFVDTRDDNAEIYVMPFRPEDPVTAFRHARNLTRSPRGDFRPAFSPDGKRIAFSSDRDVPFRGGYPGAEIARARGLPEETPWPVGGDIYIMDADGSNPVRLTDANDDDGSPAWSRDGNTIYFSSYRRPGTGQVSRVWRMNSDGSDQNPLLSGNMPGLSPTVMDDGRVAFFAPDPPVEDDEEIRNWRIFSVAVDGTDLRPESPPEQDCRGPKLRPGTGELLCYGGPPHQQMLETYVATPLFRAPGQRNRVRLPDRTLEVQALHRHFPAVSPEGLEIVSTVRGDAADADVPRLVVAPVDGGEGREIYRPEQNYDRSFYLFGLSWADDWIAFSAGPAFAPLAEPVDIWKVRSDGSGATNLTAGSNTNDAWPNYSPDGERIVFRSGRDGNFEIYLMDADGSNVRRLTDDPGIDTMPAFSPEDNLVAFSSNRDGEYKHTDFDIYLLDLTSEGEPGLLRRLTHSPGPDMHVRFSPDGEWIIYTSKRGGFNDEFDLSFTDAGQPYGEIYAQHLSDGLVIRLTHNKWEDGPVAWGKSPASAAASSAP